MNGGVFIVVYLDILFIINFVITFLLLEITASLTKKEPKLWRIILSSAFGGLYSFVILLDNIPTVLLTLSKLVACGIIILIAFRFYRVAQYFKTMLVFFFSNLIFLGFVIAICFVTKTKAIAVNNSVVYFNISATTLIVCSVIAYLVSCLVIRLYNRSLSSKEIYTLQISNNGNTVNLFAFLDTGNRLREPFSNSPVIVANADKLKDVIGDTELRVIPTATVGKDAVLYAFKPDKLVLASSKNNETLENVYVALSSSINSANYSAILNPDILSI